MPLMPVAVVNVVEGEATPGAIEFETAGITSDLTNFSAPAGTNTKNTTWTQLIASTSFDADGFYLRWVGVNGVADLLIDIGVGASSSEVAIVENMLITGCNGYTASGWCYMPLAVPAGVRLSCRSQSTDASANMNIGLNLVRGGYYETISCTRATTYGANTADSGGVSVDPGGSANTFGNWIEISSSTTNPIKHFVACVGGQNNAVRTDATHGFEIGTGANPDEVTLGPRFFVRQIGGPFDGVFPALHDAKVDEVPAGTRLVARQACSITDATDRLFDVAVIGFD